MILLFSNLSAQESKLTHRAVCKYPTNISFKYSCSEQTNTERINEKKENFVFNRSSETFFSMRNTELSKSEFQKIEVKTDSIHHTLEAGGKKWYYHTRVADIVSAWNEDVEQYQIPMSRTFDYWISPYFEFADLIPIKQLEIDRNDIEKSKAKMSASDYLIWRNSLSDERLYHLTDVKKIEFPVNRMPKDTVWNSPIEFQVNGVTFYDTVQVKFADERGGYIFMETSFKAKRFLKDSVIIYGYRQQPVQAVDADLDCTYKLTITPQGTIEDAVLEATGYIKFAYKSESIVEFTDKIKTKTIWKQLGRYNW